MQLYKFRLVIRYNDEETYKDLLTIAEKYHLSCANNVEKEQFIMFINDVDILVLVAQDICRMVS